MSEEIGPWRVTYTPGEWLVLGGPTVLVVLPPAPAHVAPMVRTLWEVAVQAGSLDALVQELAQYNIERMPEFAAFFWHGSEMRSLVRGGMRVLDAETGRALASGEGVQTWTETGLGHVRRVRLALDPHADKDVLTLPLVVGAVTASTIELDASPEARVRSPQGSQVRVPDALPTEAAAEAQAPLNPGGHDASERDDAAADESERDADDPKGQNPLVGARTEKMPSPAAIGTPDDLADEGDAQLLAPEDPVPAVGRTFGEAAPNPFAASLGIPSLGAGAAYAPPPTPQRAEPPAREQQSEDAILGIRCAQEHPNPPEAQRCRRCGGPLQGQPRMVPRPVMATLRPSNGPAADVDRTILVGRSPQAKLAGRRDAPRLLTVVSPNHDISRTHLQISPADWEVVVTDLHSTNGTLLIRPGQPESERLLPGEPVKVYPGCVIDLGDGVTILVDHPD